MGFNTKELIIFVGELCKQEKLKICVPLDSEKGAAISSGTAFIGGLVGGSVGSTVGEMAGSLIALAFSKGRPKSAVDIILNDMTPAQHENLANCIKRFLNDLEVEDASYLMPLVMSNAGVKDGIVKEVSTFLSNEMKLKVN